MKLLLVLISLMVVGCATVPAGYGQPKIYNAEGVQIGYITKEHGGTYVIRDREGRSVQTIKP